ncbi:hypothetical protein AVEN_91966-1, partial [Araneus ventricosus]
SVLFHRKGLPKESTDLARRLENLERDVCSPSSDCPDELLYGRAGFLFALLFLQKHLPGPDEFRENTIKEASSNRTFSDFGLFMNIFFYAIAWLFSLASV